MGATNSQPRSAEIVNPNSIQVSRAVVERLEQAREEKAGPSAGPFTCEHCKKQSGSADAPTTLEHQMGKDVPEVEPVDWPWKQRAVEIEETQFEESVKRVEELFGAPLKWAENLEDEIKQMEKELTACYKEHPNETLQCEPLAKQYHSFIFTNHFKAISKQDSPPKSSRMVKDLFHIEAKQENIPDPLVE